MGVPALEASAFPGPPAGPATCWTARREQTLAPSTGGTHSFISVWVLAFNEKRSTHEIDHFSSLRGPSSIGLRISVLSCGVSKASDGLYEGDVGLHAAPAAPVGE